MIFSNDNECDCGAEIESYACVCGLVRSEEMREIIRSRNTRQKSQGDAFRMKRSSSSIMALNSPSETPY